MSSGTDERLAVINRKNALRLLPLMLAGYVLNNIDKSNVGVAALAMNRDLGFTPSIFGFGAGIFFITYTLFQVPSNLGLERFGSRRWLGGILIAWGLGACATAATVGPKSFYMLRLLLGVAEAGWYPGLLFFMCCWFPKAFRARAFTWVALGVPISAAIGFPVGGALLELPTVFGLVNWQWLFIIEGLPSVLVGVLSLIWLRDGPHEAYWLTSPQREELADALEGERAVEDTRHLSVWSTLWHPLVPFFCLVHFLYAMNVFGVFMWIPRLVKDLGGLTYAQVGMVSAMPFLCAAVAVFLCGRSSDRWEDRKWHISGMLLIGAAGTLGVALSTDAVYKILFLCIAVAGVSGQANVLYAFATEVFGNISPTSKILAIRLGILVMSGGVGGFLAPYLVGLVLERFGNFSYALCSASAMLFLTSLLMALASRRFLGLDGPSPVSAVELSQWRS
ncbi:MFS transporter [Paraburkholderia silvatlantica]|uniref:ACS family tartrate transporter-like MFS transporter n=1 Tax=Paraburkholderia silvatlantica TaxID=321895 RepID=A0ABR6FX12_9BURK|nr:MFS transporter [Paraburkholderia silvatlantica]MBB2931972.1 ACS family tartrate transporter-like MFS transporter [Paraburkholderia silvatlantica]PVY24649.1 ACS family tartrate transporter-like MFS transporter [Paraburkholderia silvatlantica]PXW31145.1 ACS family tartrate transporter-like MFS transporter [Paraburkholderia silvatlantica]